MARPALEAAEAGAFLNRRLLSLAKRRRTSMRPVNLNDRIYETFGFLKRGVGQRISIHLDLAADLWLAAADPAEFDGAVLNLVLNSRDAMPDGGEIKIQTRNQRTDAAPALQTGRRPGDFVCLVVTDTGMGMKEDVLQRALDPFFTTKPEGDSAGLGLSAIDNFAKEMGGFVSIESQPGAGATVTLSLPRAAGTGSLSRATTSNDNAPRGDGEVVLVVEDDDRVREVTLKRVEALGYVVEEASSADEARARLTAGGVDLVLSDIVMPGAMDGVGLARWMSVNHPSLPIVLATAFSGGAGAGELRRISRRSHIDKALFAQGACGGSLTRIVPRPRSSRRDVDSEDIADATHALDDSGLVRRSLELPPEPSHVSVERAVERRPLMSLNSLRELVPGEHTRRVLDEQSQQPKLRVCQVDQANLARPQFAFDEVESAMVEGADAKARGSAVGRRQGRLIAPENAVDP